jgi:hypothetical protein
MRSGSTVARGIGSFAVPKKKDDKQGPKITNLVMGRPLPHDSRAMNSHVHTSTRCYRILFLNLLFVPKALLLVTGHVVSCVAITYTPPTSSARDRTGVERNLFVTSHTSRQVESFMIWNNVSFHSPSNLCAAYCLSSTYSLWFSIPSPTSVLLMLERNIN